MKKEAEDIKHMEQELRSGKQTDCSRDHSGPQSITQ